ncbi:TPA: hypothetical protein ACHAUQ_002864, partial [Enterococcus faecium]
IDDFTDGFYLFEKSFFNVNSLSTSYGLILEWGVAKNSVIHFFSIKIASFDLNQRYKAKLR